MSRRRTLFSNTDSDSDVEAVLRTSRRGRPRKLQKSSGFGATRRPSSSSAYGSHQDQSVGNYFFPEMPDNAAEMPPENSTEPSNPPEETEWEDHSMFSDLHSNAYENYFNLGSCIRCSDAPGIYRCVTCRLDFCEDCKEITHGDFAPHKFEQWNSETLMFADPVHVPMVAALFCCVASREARELSAASTVELIDLSGIVQAQMFTCSSCDKVDALLSMGYFPSYDATATATDCTAYFAISLLTLLDNLTTVGRLPAHRAIKALFLGATVGQGICRDKLASSLYQRLQRHCVLLKFRQLQIRSAKWPKSCLLCPDQHNDRQTVVCADALFGWQRFSSMGFRQALTPSDGRPLPVPLVNVDVKADAPKNRLEEQNCPSWKAGALEPPSRGAGRHDVYGFFGLFCRHNRLLNGCNITTTGERFCYIEQCLEHFLRDTSVSKKLLLIYDVGCRVSARVQSAVTKSGANVQASSCAINAFHALGHKPSCQRRFSVRVTPGAGLCDGENTERAWAQLRPYGHSLKYMRPDRRSTCMSQILFHFNANQLFNTPQWFQQRLRLLDSTIKNMSSEMNSLLDDARIQQASGILDGSLVLSEVQIRNLGRQWHQNSLIGAVENSENDLLSNIRSLAVLREHWLRQSGLNMGQGHNRACLRRVQGLTSEMKADINRLPEETRGSFDQYRKPNSSKYDGLSESATSVRFRRRAIDLYHKYDRVNEELHIVSEEWYDFIVKMDMVCKSLDNQAGLAAQFRKLFRSILERVVNLDVPARAEYFRLILGGAEQSIENVPPISNDSPTESATESSASESDDSEDTF
ncbi:hypothetical protein BOX15_Mlig001681g7 [Macrostomum lignano]|uniref:B box-type domain-containing protein n=2 Tax=Macrostomum lignano TaxID=282301 RepID=A0A267F2P0_9PLAT|nr:hypothetical protein BOX15_Mlig001681g7 [Macrostomum lignano]